MWIQWKGHNVLHISITILIRDFVVVSFQPLPPSLCNGITNHYLVRTVLRTVLTVKGSHKLATAEDENRIDLAAGAGIGISVGNRRLRLVGVPRRGQSPIPSYRTGFATDRKPYC